MNKKILIYYSSNKLSVDLISLIIGLKNVGYDVSLLTSCPKGVLHNELEKEGVLTDTIKYEKNFLFFIKHIYYLYSYSKKNKIDIVYSHVQVSNFIASIAQFFSKSTFFMCRHHSDYVWKGNNKKAKIMDRIINKLSKNIIAISDKVYNQIVDVEKVNKNKVIRINLGYNFDLYPKVNFNKVENIKEKYKTDFLLLNIGRLIPLKRQALLIESCSILLNKGIDLKLIILGNGKEKKRLKQLILESNNENKIYLKGQVNNVLDYISAANIVVHPSSSEASSTVGKESALCQTPIIACENVGDFNSYINHNSNYLIPLNLTKEQLASKLEGIIADKKDIKQQGEILYQQIITQFDISNVIEKYKLIF